MQALFEKDDPLALLRAAQLGDETITREFLNKFRNEVLCKYVCMILSSHEELWSSLSYIPLLYTGMQINRRFEDDDLTVLHHAALFGQTSIIKILIEYGADKDPTVKRI